MKSNFTTLQLISGAKGPQEAELLVVEFVHHRLRLSILNDACFCFSILPTSSAVLLQNYASEKIDVELQLQKKIEFCVGCD